MTNLARIGVVTVAATLAGLIGAGAANAVPLSQLGGTGTYAVGNIDPAQMFPGTYLTYGPVAGDVSCEWAIRALDGGVRTEGKAIGSTRIVIADGETLETRNCQSWIRELVPSDAMMAAILGGAGLAGTGSAVLGTGLAAVLTTAILTGKDIALSFGIDLDLVLGLTSGSAGGANSGSAADPGAGSATDSAAGSVAGLAAALASGSTAGSAANIN